MEASATYRMPSATLKPSTKVENVAAVPTPLAAPACVVPLPPAMVVTEPGRQRGKEVALGKVDKSERDTVTDIVGETLVLARLSAELSAVCEAVGDCDSVCCRVEITHTVRMAVPSATKRDKVSVDGIITMPSGGQSK